MPQGASARILGLPAGKEHLLPRSARSLAPGSYYYVTTWAGRDTLLFRDDDDCRAWISVASALLEEVGGIRLPAWCLLPESVHLIVRDEGTALPSFMRKLLGRYSRARRDLYGTGRRLYGGERYRSVRLEEGELVAVFSHVAHLPASSGLVLFPDTWEWCSTQDWLGSSTSGITWLDPALAGCPASERAGMIRRILDTAAAPLSLAAGRGRGHAVEKRADAPRMLPSDPAGLLAKELGVRKRVLLAPKGREQRKIRHRAFEECRTRWGMNFAEIARAFGVTPGAVVQALSGPVRACRPVRTGPPRRRPVRKKDENQERLL